GGGAGAGARALLPRLPAPEPCSGEVELDGARGLGALRGGSAFVPAPRTESLYGNLTVGDNLGARLGRPRIAGHLFAISRRRIRTIARNAVATFRIKTRSI